MAKDHDPPDASIIGLLRALLSPFLRQTLVPESGQCLN